MCKLALLNISPDSFWKSVTDLTKETEYVVSTFQLDSEYVFRVKLVNAAGDGPPSPVSLPISISAEDKDRRPSARSCSTINDTESLDYSQFSDFTEISEYDPELDETFLDHDVIISTDRKMEDSYEVIEQLGKGRFGLVQLVGEKTTGRMWAAKMIKCRSSQRQEVMNEVDIMNTLRHKKLARLYEVFDHGKEVVLIQELVGGGELFERIIDDDFNLCESDCTRFMKQICDGIGYMHSQCIVHLDLKPENIMCVSKSSNQIKLIDFGLARRFKPGDALRIMFGTPEFVAPEVVSYDAIAFNTDMWSVGVICYILLSGLSPFMGDSDSETFNNVTAAAWDFEDEAFDDISENSKDFVSKLLVKEKENRMSALECLTHPWLLENRCTTRQTQTLEKSKVKMKKFIARRKWQKHMQAIRAISRMRISFSKRQASLSTQNAIDLPDDISEHNNNSTLARKSSDDNKTILARTPSTEAPDDVFIEQLSPTHFEQNTTVRDLSQTDPSPPNLYPKITEDSKSIDATMKEINKIGSRSKLRLELVKEEPLDADNVPEITTPTDVEQSSVSDLADGRDSGYGGRKSTPDLECAVDDPNVTCEPIFLSELPSEITVIEGDACRLDVSVESRSSAEISWFKDGKPLEICRRIELEDGTDGRNSLILRQVKLSDDAEYECRITNKLGTNSSFTEIYVVAQG